MQSRIWFLQKCLKIVMHTLQQAAITAAVILNIIFPGIPNIIRRNRTSVAILTGKETAEELNLLADDMQLYYGMGCRNVTKFFVPEGYDFIELLDALRRYNHFADFHKYRNNYDYQLALLILNRKFYMTNDSIILTENESVFAPVSQVNYSYYNETKTLVESLNE